MMNFALDGILATSYSVQIRTRYNNSEEDLVPAQNYQIHRKAKTDIFGLYRTVLLSCPRSLYPQLFIFRPV